MTRVHEVLIVEDDPHLSQLIAELLQDAGYTVSMASTGATALARLEAEPLDLVILDWMLPDMAGDQLCRTIKARCSETFLPILMLTARSALADRIAGLEAGADDYLTKPFHADELLARARALLRIRTAELERSAARAELARQRDELQEAYNKLRATQAQLLQTSKLAALGELVAGVAHELNNPLAIILGNAELLPELADPDYRRAVEQIIAGAQRARRVVQSLTTFARHGPLEEHWYDPRDLIERALDLRRAALHAAGIALDVRYAPDLPLLWVDGPQIQQVLLNLVLNAEQALAGRPDPRIAIRVFTSAMPVGAPPLLPDATVAAGPVSGERAVVFDVADNGPGVDESIRSRVFEPFVTTKPVGQGAGLSLAISYGIVARHHGSLQFSSEPGHGTTFRVALPVRQPESVAAAPEPAAPAQASHRNVLVVDDEPAILDMIRRVLARRGYQVTGISSAQQALALLQQQAYDVVLCDIKMPDMDGMAFYTQFQATALEHQPRVVIMTGDTSNTQTSEFLQRSKLPVLSKPFTRQELLAVLADAQE